MKDEEKQKKEEQMRKKEEEIKRQERNKKRRERDKLKRAKKAKQELENKKENTEETSTSYIINEIKELIRANEYGKIIDFIDACLTNECLSKEFKANLIDFKKWIKLKQKQEKGNNNKRRNEQER